MFNTLRAKLISSYAAVALLSLLLALAVTVGLAQSFGEKTTYRTLHEKGAFIFAFVQVELANNQRPLPQPMLARLRDGIIHSGVRVLLVDANTMTVVEDISSRGQAVGKTFYIEGGSQDPALFTTMGAEGKFRYLNEDVRYQYVARELKINPLRRNLGGTSGNYIVVLAEPQRGVAQLAKDLFEFLGPATVVALLMSLMAAYALARSISRPIARLAEAAAAMTRGDYSQRIPVEGHDELSSLTQRFNEMAEQVGQAHRMERDFVANVSHDLKTPLTSIKGFSQAIIDGAIVDEEGQRQAAGIIYGEAERMSRLVSELLSLSRLQNSLNSLEMVPTDVQAILSHVVLAMQPQAARAGVKLELGNLGQAVAVMADGDKLKQAFSNLLDNALKFTPSGGLVTITVDVSSRVEITVCDTGQGIPPEDLPRVMERFYQVDKSRSTIDGRSAGLGLAIAQEIVLAHRGELVLESSPAVGTTVRIYLPLYASQKGSQPGISVLRRLNPAARTQPVLNTEPTITGKTNR